MNHASHAWIGSTGPSVGQGPHDPSWSIVIEKRALILQLLPLSSHAGTSRRPGRALQRAVLPPSPRQAAENLGPKWLRGDGGTYVCVCVCEPVSEYPNPPSCETFHAFGCPKVVLKAQFLQPGQLHTHLCQLQGLRTAVLVGQRGCQID